MASEGGGVTLGGAADEVILFQVHCLYLLLVSDMVILTLSKLTKAFVKC